MPIIELQFRDMVTKVSFLVSRTRSFYGCQSKKIAFMSSVQFDRKSIFIILSQRRWKACSFLIINDRFISSLENVGLRHVTTNS